jgi:hypothetical protein
MNDDITIPRICRISADDYHRDPAQTPSLSAGMIDHLLVAPALCYHRSRRLNPDFVEPEGQEKFSIGTVSHLIHLEPERFADAVVVVDAADWRTKAAQEARKAAQQAGKTAVLDSQMQRILAARSALLRHPIAASAFTGGAPELSMFWQHPEHGFWCRARPDYLAEGGAYLADYKATANADPRRFDKHACDMGYHRRAAWYLDGARILLGEEPAHYWFVNQEVAPPHLVSVCELDADALEIGRIENARACALFARCLESGDWFGYRHADDDSHDRSFTVSLPRWKVYQALELGE